MNLVRTNKVSTPPLRVLIVDDHPVFLTAMEGIFRLHVKLAHVSVATSLAQVKKVVCHYPHTDLVFLDLQLPDSNGLDTVRVVSDLLPHASIVVLTGYAPDAVKRACLKLGAHQVLDKALKQDGLINAVLDHTERLTHFVSSPSDGDGYPARLSRRQHDVLTLIVQGYSNREIAFRLFISEATVKAHTTAIFRSLGVRTRAEVIALNVQKPAD